jgi:hypothetical protein
VSSETGPSHHHIPEGPGNQQPPATLQDRGAVKYGSLYQRSGNSSRPCWIKLVPPGVTWSSLELDRQQAGGRGFGEQCIVPIALVKPLCRV